MLFNLHTHQALSNAIVNIDDIQLEIEAGKYYSLGNHPYKESMDISIIEQQLQQHSQIIALGECGIDKLKGNYPLATQIAIFKQQVYLSEKYQKPMILHVVRGFNEIIALKKELQPKQKWIIHGFNKYKMAAKLIEAGFDLSFGKAMVSNLKLQEAFKTIPLQNIFLETDSSAVTIQEVYYIASIVKNMSIEDIAKQIMQNVKTIFNDSII